MYTRRAMVEADIPQVASLISRAWTEHGAGAEMHVGDLYWALFHKQREIVELASQVWVRDDDGVIAFSMRSDSGWYDLVIEPGIDPKAILKHVVEDASNHVSGARDGASPRIGRRIGVEAAESFLANAGYRRMAFGYPTLEHSLSSIEVPVVPAGFVIKSMGESTVTEEERAAAWQSAFPEDGRDAVDIASLRRAPGYESELDFVCESETGDLAAFCTVWFDSVSKTGLFEPVGTVEKFQRRGLGAAMIGEALVRLKRRGAERAYVRVHSENAKAMAFYQSCGFREASSRFGFEKVVAEKAE